MAIAHLLAQFTRWKTIVQCLGRFWLRLIFIRPLADIERCANHSPFPHGASVLDRDPQRQAYIAAIKEINIPQLASSYNLGKEWVAVGYPDHGSFNFCVFVVFPQDGTKWVVWFPICPLLHKPWRKLKTEVATLECLRAKTTIRVPEVDGHELDAQRAASAIQDFELRLYPLSTRL